MAHRALSSNAFLWHGFLLHDGIQAKGKAQNLANGSDLLKRQKRLHVWQAWWPLRHTLLDNYTMFKTDWELDFQ